MKKVYQNKKTFIVELTPRELNVIRDALTDSAFQWLDKADKDGINRDIDRKIANDRIDLLNAFPDVVYGEDGHLIKTGSKTVFPIFKT